MRKIISKLELWLVKERSECQFNTQASEQIILMAGLGGYPGFLFPLVRFLRENGHTATVIPLGLNMSSLDTTVLNAFEYLEEKLLRKSNLTKVTLFGHSFGGRVACMLAHRIKQLHPDIACEIITAGSPLSPRKPIPIYLPWYVDTWFRLIFLGYREWKPIVQPNPQSIKLVGFYSLNDELVYPEYARQDYQGKLIELSGFSHNDLISPKKIGKQLLKVL